MRGILPQVLRLHKSQVLKINLFSPMTNNNALLLIFRKVLTAEGEPIQITWCWAENLSPCLDISQHSRNTKWEFITRLILVSQNSLDSLREC